MDDMTAYLKDNEISKKLKEFVYNRRHKHLSIIFLVQSWISVPKDIRKLFSNIFIFKVSKKEMETIFEEVIELPKDYILPIIKLVFDKPYQFLFVNTDSQRMFKNFDELLIE
jgi:tyrosyl-tRNA synthetase